MRLTTDTRAQSMTYLLAAGTLILFAGLYAVFQQPAAQLLDAATSNCVTEQCETGVGHVAEMWTWLPLVVALFVVVMVLAASIYKSGRGL